MPLPGAGGGVPMAGPQQEAMMRRFQKKARIAATLKRIGHVLVVMSGKGGVGKSTVATNIAFALALKGHKVGLADMDVTNPNVPTMTGLAGKPLLGTSDAIVPYDVPPGVKVVSSGFLTTARDQPIIWRGPLKTQLIGDFLSEVQWGDLDYLIVDLPPGTSDETLSIAQEIPHADGAIVVTTPQEVSLENVRQSIRFAQTVKLHCLGIVENMAPFPCPHCGGEVSLFGVGGGEKAAAEYGLAFLGRIPFDPLAEQGSDSGTPIVVTHPGAPSSKAFHAVIETIEAELKKRPTTPTGEATPGA